VHFCDNSKFCSQQSDVQKQNKECAFVGYKIYYYNTAINLETFLKALGIFSTTAKKLGFPMYQLLD
jgi:hypothetical protein